MSTTRDAARDAVVAVFERHRFSLPGVADLSAGAAIGALRDPSPALKEALADAIFNELGNPSDWPGVDEQKIMAAVVDAVMAGA